MTAPCFFRGDRRNSITPLWISRLALVVAAGLATSQVGSAVPVSLQFSSSTTGIEVYATVTDAAGKPVRGLTISDFELLEDGVAQSISAFAAGDFPLRVAVALDHSFSMAGDPLRAAKAATRTFLSALN